MHLPGGTSGAATISRVVDASAEALWDVLADGWLYPLWVVGASRMRDVDDGWPAIGTQLHHSVGAWPLLIDDRTEVLDVTVGKTLRLKAHAWPSGAAEVRIEIEPDGPRCQVHLREDATDGPGVLVPRMLRQLAIAPRNRESLRRLALIAERR